MTSPTPPDDAPPTPAEDLAPPASGRPRRSLLGLGGRRRAPSPAERARRAAEGAAPATPAPVPPAVPGEVPDALLTAPPESARPGGLRRRRRRLVRRRQDAIYHLGGLAFELYRRDLLEEDVMRRRAARVEALDDTVRLIDARLEEATAARREPRRGGAGVDQVVGTCTACRTPFRAGARFCSNCGTPLVPPVATDEQVTQAIPAPPPGRTDAT